MHPKMFHCEHQLFHCCDYSGSNFGNEGDPVGCMVVPAGPPITAFVKPDEVEF